MKLILLSHNVVDGEKLKTGVYDNIMAVIDEENILGMAMPDTHEVEMVDELFDGKVGTAISSAEFPNPQTICVVAYMPGIPLRDVTFVGTNRDEGEAAQRAGCAFVWAWDWFGWEGAYA